jgi:uncharacterized membrane-anchored protein YhcB (DUF1043 family)
LQEKIATDRAENQQEANDKAENTPGVLRNSKQETTLSRF